MRNGAAKMCASGIFIRRISRHAPRMSWRFHEHILRGELDNRTRGRVRGRIWLAGVEEPLALDLAGDCAADLAGCALAFENPEPVAMTTRPPAAPQRGIAGEITAARRVRVFDVPLAEAFAQIDAGETPPSHLAPALVIEWFNPRCGEFRFETTEFRLTVSESAWRFTAAESAAREMEFADEESEFHHAVWEDGEDGDWDEFRNEQLLRFSETMTERTVRLHEQYGRGDEAERIIAHLMGWERIEEHLAEKLRTGGDPLAAAESGDEFSPADFDDFEEPEPDPTREGIDWVRDAEERIVHPIYKSARDLCSEAMDEFDESAIGAEDAGAEEFVCRVMTLSAKLGGALNGLARAGEVRDAAFTVARIKRVLEHQNAALAALRPLEGKAFASAARAAHYRAALFEIREELIALIARLRGE